MSNTNVEIGSGWTLITVTLIILKAIGYLDISWWWVFAPTWIPLLIVLLILVFILLAAIVSGILEAW